MKEVNDQLGGFKRPLWDRVLLWAWGKSAMHDPEYTRHEVQLGDILKLAGFTYGTTSYIH